MAVVKEPQQSVEAVLPVHPAAQISRDIQTIKEQMLISKVKHNITR